jgi:hypothetical protein
MAADKTGSSGDKKFHFSDKFAEKEGFEKTGK